MNGRISVYTAIRSRGVLPIGESFNYFFTISDEIKDIGVTPVTNSGN